MDDIIRSISKSKIEAKLQEINSMHLSLKFTIEVKQDRELPFLDMKIIRKDWYWYTKPTDTGLIMNFNWLAPLKYKRAVVTGFVHRILDLAVPGSYFHESLSIANKIRLDNQYPESFYEPLISETLQKLFI